VVDTEAMRDPAVLDGDDEPASGDVSRYAFVYGIKRTKQTLGGWRDDHWRVLRRWFVGSFAVAILLLLAVWAVAGVSSSNGAGVEVIGPPFAVGGWHDVLTIFGRNLLVLAFHALACVAGFIAGSSLPLQVEGKSGFVRVIHERGGTVAITFVVAATLFSLSAQALALGGDAAAVAAQLHTTPGILLITLMAHAPLELTALFLPLAAWIIASRRGEWDQLLAATWVTVLIALPMLFAAAYIEVFVSPHVLHALIG
jgi:hypothetical protein